MRHSTCVQPLPIELQGKGATATDFLICAAAERRGLPILTTDADFIRFGRHLPIQLHGATAKWRVLRTTPPTLPETVTQSMSTPRRTVRWLVAAEPRMPRWDSL